MGPVRVLLAILLVSGVTSVPWAEDIPSERTAEPRRIEEILVTAQKKEERQQDVPISISTLGGDFLEKTDVDTFHEVAEFAPNVHVTTDACCSIYVRGFGSPLAPTGFDPSVGFAIDELTVPRDAFMSDPLYDLARIEVLRGSSSCRRCCRPEFGTRG